MYVEGFWWKFPAMVGSLAVTGALVFGMVVGFKECAKPNPCTETAEVITSSMSQRECQQGGRIVTQEMQSQSGHTAEVLVRCLCTIDADGGQ